VLVVCTVLYDSMQMLRAETRKKGLARPIQADRKARKANGREDRGEAWRGKNAAAKRTRPCIEHEAQVNGCAKHPEARRRKSSCRRFGIW
jgi:hypothetical protein